MKIILASLSPRRKEILERFGYDFTIENSNYIENGGVSDPVITCLRFAKNKASGVFFGKSEKERSDIAVVGADTVVYYGGKILGKPKDSADAVNTLKLLSGKTHVVITGFAVLSEKSSVFGYDVSKVTFNDLSDELIRNYVATGKPMDKAGSYGVQDGYDLVRGIIGSRYNVIGFPIEKIKPVLDGLIE